MHQHYVRLGAMTLLSFASMYVLMYSMVNTFGNVYPNFNQFYMAGLMAAPMLVFEIALMGMMYKNKTVNMMIVAGSVVALTIFWFAIREQAAISDEQFLKSMIPHHAGAILMCEKASIQDAEIRELCRGIVAGQSSEIERMKGILERLNR